MRNKSLIGRMLALLLLFSLSTAACIQPIAAPPVQALKPGDKIGEMVVAQGPIPFDLGIPPHIAFCNANPEIDPNTSVGKPGIYTVECAAPPLPKMAIGFGWVSNDAEILNDQWSAIRAQLYVNGQLIDQMAFGSLDADVPITAAPGEDASKVIYMKLRTWNVVLENLTPGQLELRLVWTVARDLVDELTTIPQGVYDITYKITVDEALAEREGAPAPIELIQQTATIFDSFNAAVNAHDVDKALSFFSDDATAQFPNQPLPNRFTGSAEIRTWLEMDAKDNVHVALEDIQTAGDTVRATGKVTADSLPPDLVLVGTVEVTVVDGKITSFSYTLDNETLAKIQAFSRPAPVEFVRRIDTSAQQIKVPVSLAVDSQGNIYVTDGSDTPRVLKYDNQGNFVLAWGEPGSAEGQFQFSPPTPDAGPIGGFLAVDRQDNVYISDAFNGRVQKFDATGKFLMQFGSKGAGEGQFDEPGAGPIYVDSQGNIYVSTFPRVQKFDPSGKFLLVYGTAGDGDGEFNAAAIGTVDAQGNLYIADGFNHRLQKLDATGKFLLQWGHEGIGPGQFYWPVAAVLDSAHKLYVADNLGRIQIFDTEGNFLDQWSETGAGNPPLGGEISGLAIDGQDNIYVADVASPSIYVFRPRR